MKFKEKDFYKPIIEFFETKLAKDLKLEIKIWEAHKGIPSEVKTPYPNIEDVLNSLRSYFPDLIGLIGANPKKLIIIEVKDDPLKLKDLYQTKRYSEIINADYSFLVSPEYFNKEDEQLIKNDEIAHIKNYYLKLNSDILVNKILIGKINYEILDKNIKINEIIFDSQLKIGIKNG